MNNQTENYGLEQAKAQMESITELVAALNVDYDRLEELHEKVGTFDAEYEDSVEKAELELVANGNESLEDAQERIQESPLSVQVRSGWHTPGAEGMGAEEFEILLCTGGPAVRIVGDLDEHMEPVNPRIQYQDWGTLWTNYPLTNSEHDAVVEYCQQFYFGE